MMTSNGEPWPPPRPKLKAATFIKSLMTDRRGITWGDEAVDGLVSVRFFTKTDVLQNNVELIPASSLILDTDELTEIVQRIERPE